MLGNLGNAGAMMKQMKELKKAQKEMKNTRVTVDQDGIKVTVNGEMKIQEILLSDDVDIAALPSSLKKTINDAMTKVQVESSQKLAGMAQALNLPGIGKS